MDVTEFNAYREQTERIRWIMWWAILLGCVAVGLLVGYVWSFVVGIPLAAVLSLLGRTAYLRVNKALVIRRFPELANRAVRWQMPDFPPE